MAGTATDVDAGELEDMISHNDINEMDVALDMCDILGSDYRLLRNTSIEGLAASAKEEGLGADNTKLVTLGSDG
jgi:hypothetical protein